MREVWTRGGAFGIAVGPWERPKRGVYLVGVVSFFFSPSCSGCVEVEGGCFTFAEGSSVACRRGRWERGGKSGVCARVVVQMRLYLEMKEQDRRVWTFISGSWLR